MKHIKYTYYNITLLSLLVLFASSLAFSVNAQNPCPDAPVYETEQYFCSEAAWAQIGESIDYLSDLQIFPDKPTYFLSWYKDQELTQKITNPKAQILVDGEVYYVTQTNPQGCESNSLEIVVLEKDCGCIKDPGFEDQEGTDSSRGYEFYRFQGVNNHKTCGQSMQGATQVQLGTIDGYNLQSNITLVTTGKDNIIQNMDRTNPNNPKSTHALRINRGVPGGENRENISSMSKTFIASEIFSFSFSLALENPGHLLEHQPFAQINLYDEQDNLIQSRCLISNPDDCIFKSMDFGNNSELLYSDWTCIKMNTINYIGQPLRAEFISAYCAAKAHYSFMYVDDLFAGEDSDEVCNDSAFGYVKVNSVFPPQDACYIIPEIEDELCSPSQNETPGFPISVCGEYSAPISHGDIPFLENIEIHIIQDDVVVGVVANSEIDSSSNTFCILIEESDVDALPFGEFTFNVELVFSFNCGSEDYFYITDRSTYSFCPPVDCPDMLQTCDLTGNGFNVFDLTDHGNMFYNTSWSKDDVTISYYVEEEDANDKKNSILNPKTFENSTAYFQTVYMRLDWKVQGVSAECYYLVPLDLEVIEIPLFPIWEEEIFFCDYKDINYLLSAVPENLEDLKFVNYKWYKDGEQLLHSGSYYTATETGEYTVVISEENCEIEQSIKISQLGLDVSLPNSEVKVCNQDSYTIVPNVRSIGETDIDLEEVKYQWSTGETTKDITVTESGTYTLEATYGDCNYITTKMVFLSDRPELSTLENLTLCKGDIETVMVGINHPDKSALEIEWYRDGGLVAENVEELDITEAGVYKVVVGSALVNDCEDDVTFTVAYFDNENCIVPEGLSPNNDGYNDNLDLAFLDNKHGIHSLQIFNRHGLEVYSKDNYINEWYGQSKNNKTLPVGVYFYIITLKDGSEDITGNIYLNY